VKQLCLALLWMACALPASAATYTIAAGTSSSSIQSTLNTAAAAGGANTVVFAAGTYSVTAAMTIPCPANGGSLTVTGPTVPLAGYNPGDGYVRYGYTPTATFNPTSGVATSTWGFNFPACTNPRTLEFVEYNGGQQNPDGGGAVYIDGTGTSNVTIQYNYFHGNWANVNGGNTIDNLILIDGCQGCAQSQNITIAWNRLGAQGDCQNIMSGENYDGNSEEDGGFCNALGSYGSSTNFTFSNNVVYYQE
jgi:hypothetical protein